MSTANVEIARRGFEAIARGDLGAIGELLDDEVKWHGGDPSAPYACHNRDQAIAFMRAAIDRRGVGQLVDAIDAGDRVVVVLRPPSASGTAPLRANVTTFRAGKVVEMVSYESPAEALAAAGVARR